MATINVTPSYCHGLVVGWQARHTTQSSHCLPQTGTRMTEDRCIRQYSQYTNSYSLPPSLSPSYAIVPVANQIGEAIASDSCLSLASDCSI